MAEKETEKKAEKQQLKEAFEGVTLHLKNNRSITLTNSKACIKFLVDNKLTEYLQ